MLLKSSTRMTTLLIEYNISRNIWSIIRSKYSYIFLIILLHTPTRLIYFSTRLHARAHVQSSWHRVNYKPRTNSANTRDRISFFSAFSLVSFSFSQWIHIWKLERPGSKEFVLATWPWVELSHVFSLEDGNTKKDTERERYPSWLLGSFPSHIVTCFSADIPKLKSAGRTSIDVRSARLNVHLSPLFEEVLIADEQPRAIPSFFLRITFLENSLLVKWEIIAAIS